jgi:sialidase-1
MLSAASLAAPAEGIDKQDLFQNGEGGYFSYRIPALVATRHGAVLAFCEGRRDSASDWGNIDILMRRSTDRGRTFAPPARVAEVDGPKPQHPVGLANKMVKPEDVGYNNPTAIAARDAVHLLFCLDYGRMFWQRSTDDGATFSRPVDITAALEPLRRDYAWKVCAVGPGHGIETRDGRLLAPVWLSLAHSPEGHHPSVLTTISSDDGGRRWRAGEIAVTDTPQSHNPSEAELVELADGRIMLNARNESANRNRLVATSRDGLTRWSAPRFDPRLPEPICMASLLRVGGKHGPLLFANPDNFQNSQRRNVSVRVSDDEGIVWSATRTLEPGRSAYSDLAALNEKEIFCFYERGPRDGETPRADRLTLARFSLDWVRSGG